MKHISKHDYRLTLASRLIESLQENDTPVKSANKRPLRKNRQRTVADNDNIKKIVNTEIMKYGFKADLNHIDVSKVTDMSFLFADSEFNGDISKWDVSNVTDMAGMFYNSKFNGDISKWDVSNVEDMGGMFIHAKFNGNISNWDVSNVTNMSRMFMHDRSFMCDISNWDVSNVEDHKHCFTNCRLPYERMPEWPHAETDFSTYEAK